MNSQNTADYAEKGDLFCRRAVWTDVVKFFAFNILLHATTVVLPPGCRFLRVAAGMVCALLAPFSGLAWAIERIVRSTSHTKSQVEDAHRAGALCMLVPFRYWPGFEFRGDIHGEYPNRRAPRLSSLINYLPGRKRRLAETDSERPQLAPRWKPICVPYYFTVTPTLEREQDTHLACNYDFLKGLAAVFQICYGSFELYDSRTTQFQKYGSASYSLIVIPYILMSFLNLVSSLCRRDYPAAYLVIYKGREKKHERPREITPFNIPPPRSPPRDISPADTPASLIPQATAAPVATVNVGTTSADKSQGIRPAYRASGGSSKDDERNLSNLLPIPRDGDCQWIRDIQENVSGAVGYAYGPLEASIDDIRDTGKLRQRSIHGALLIGICAIMLAVPYILIYVLTGFMRAQSSQWERFWILSSIVLGQVVWLLPWSINRCVHMVHPQANDPAFFPQHLTFSGLMVLTGRNALRWWVLIYGLLASVPVLVSFTVVGRMILENGVCTRL